MPRNGLTGVLEKLNSKDKLFQKFKKSRLRINKELCKKAKYKALKLIATKKQSFFFKEKTSKYWEAKRVIGIP